mgnify:CR=1 FL=1
MSGGGDDPLWLVTLRDKELAGEPTVAFAVVRARSRDAALQVGADLCVDVAERTPRGRVVPSAEEVRLGAFRRVPTSWASPPCGWPGPLAGPLSGGEGEHPPER